MSMYVSNVFNYASSAVQAVREMPLQTSVTKGIGGGAGLFYGAQAGGLVALYAVEKLASFGVFSQDYKDVTQKGISGIKDPSLVQYIACVLFGIVGVIAGSYLGAQLGNSAATYGSQAVDSVAKNVFAYMKPLQA